MEAVPLHGIEPDGPVDGDEDALTPELLQAYSATQLDIQVGERLLSIRPTPGATSPLVLPPELTPPVHVITAWNPGSIPLAVSRNERRQERLRDQLAGLAVELFEATGRAVDGSWQEPSFAVTGLDRTVVCAIGHQLGQLAVYELAHDIAIVRCRDVQVVARTPGILL